MLDLDCMNEDEDQEEEKSYAFALENTI